MRNFRVLPLLLLLTGCISVTAVHKVKTNGTSTIVIEYDYSKMATLQDSGSPEEFEAQMKQGCEEETPVDGKTGWSNISCEYIGNFINRVTASVDLRTASWKSTRNGRDTEYTFDAMKILKDLEMKADADSKSMGVQQNYIVSVPGKIIDAPAGRLTNPSTLKLSVYDVANFQTAPITFSSNERAQVKDGHLTRKPGSKKGNSKKDRICSRFAKNADHLRRYPRMVKTINARFQKNFGFTCDFNDPILTRTTPTASQIAEARNAQRRSDVNTILNAIYQYAIDHNGDYPAPFKEEPQSICVSDGRTCYDHVDLSVLKGTYVVSIPIDPSVKSRDPETLASGYTVNYYTEEGHSYGRITISAPHAERGAQISVTR